MAKGSDEVSGGPFDGARIVLPPTVLTVTLQSRHSWSTYIRDGDGIWSHVEDGSEEVEA